jgi:HAD superfamily hydrolase (TIGR01549 family)
MRKISAIGFDFDHTLGIDNKLERVALLRLLDASCEEGGRCIGTLAEEIARIDALLHDQRTGRFTIEAAIEQFMRDRGARDPAACAQDYKRLCVDMVPHFVIPQPDARDTLAALRDRGVRTAILTNGWSPLQQHKAARVSFDGPIVVSADIGVQKPEPEAFEALARALDTPPNEIAYVGDNPLTDVAGALRAGMTAVWFDAEGAKYGEGTPRPSRVIHSLAELQALV